MQADFYLLDNNEDKLLFACRLLEKAYKLGHRVFVHCSDLKETETLDELLWTFRPESFIPHNIQGEGPEPPPPIQLGYNNEPRGFNEILLNLHADIPTFYKKFSRIMEIVPTNEECKQQSRKRYKEYKKYGVTIKTHNITG